MSEFKIGDRVTVTYEAVILGASSHRGSEYLWVRPVENPAGFGDILAPVSALELILIPTSPEDDPVGSFRTQNGNRWFKYAVNRWIRVRTDDEPPYLETYEDQDMRFTTLEEN